MKITLDSELVCRIIEDHVNTLIINHYGDGGQKVVKVELSGSYSAIEAVCILEEDEEAKEPEPPSAPDPAPDPLPGPPDDGDEAALVAHDDIS